MYNRASLRRSPDEGREGVADDYVETKRLPGVITWYALAASETRPDELRGQEKKNRKRQQSSSKKKKYQLDISQI